MPGKDGGRRLTNSNRKRLFSPTSPYINDSYTEIKFQ
jgi:hypothetical protein